MKRKRGSRSRALIGYAWNLKLFWRKTPAFFVFFQEKIGCFLANFGEKNTPDLNFKPKPLDLCKEVKTQTSFFRSN